MAAPGEDGGCPAGSPRLPAGGAEAGPGPGALAHWASSLHPQPRPARLPGPPPDTVRLLPPHQRDLPPRRDSPRPRHDELLLPDVAPHGQHSLLPLGCTSLPGSLGRQNISR